MVEDKGEDDKSITYTDIVGALMKSVTKIINTISYVLIAFVAISLVVSSISDPDDEVLEFNPEGNGGDEV